MAIFNVAPLTAFPLFSTAVANLVASTEFAPPPLALFFSPGPHAVSNANNATNIIKIIFLFFMSKFLLF